MRSALVALALGVAVYAFGTWAPMLQTGGDSTWSVHQAYSLAAHGDLDLDEYEALATARPGAHWTDDEDSGHIVSNFPWGGAVVNAPFVAAVAVWDEIVGDGDLDERLARSVPLDDLEIGIASAVAGVTTALLLLLLHRVSGSLAVATVLAAVFAFGTSVASTTTRALWMQGPAILLIVVLLHLLWEVEHPFRHRGRELVGPRAIPLLGPLVVLAYATRPTAVLLAPLVLVLVVARHRRWLPALAATSLLALAAFFLVTRAQYGSWTQPYYDSRLSLSTDTIGNVAANLVSPARGLLIWSPVVALAAVGLALSIRRRPLPLLPVLLGGWAVLHLVAVSAVTDRWWAGWSVGPRFMADTLPALFVLLCPVAVLLRSSALKVPARAALAGAFVVLAGWSVFANTRAAARHSVQLWNAEPVSVDVDTDRVWDWRDPQFLR